MVGAGHGVAFVKGLTGLYRGYTGIMEKKTQTITKY